ncbi:MAG: PorT family protein [Tannerella sp.]|jgi:hypothetical protein|nr:PorT family protein [Tannerella sp.]
MKIKLLKNRIVLLAIITVATAGNVWSQTVSSEDARKTRWGIKGGINVATVNIESENDFASLESVLGAVAGVTLEHSFTPRFFFHSGLDISVKGFEMASGNSSTLTSTAAYLLLPAAVGYKFNIGRGWKIEPRLGFYLACGIAGNTSATVSGESATVSTFDDDILKPFDAGTLVGAFFDNGKVVIGIQVEQGFTETNGDNFKVTGAKAHNSNVSIVAGYLF